MELPPCAVTEVSLDWTELNILRQAPNPHSLFQGGNNKCRMQPSWYLLFPFYQNHVNFSLFVGWHSTGSQWLHHRCFCVWGSERYDINVAVYNHIFAVHRHCGDSAISKGPFPRSGSRDQKQGLGVKAPVQMTKSLHSCQFCTLRLPFHLATGHALAK